MPGRCWPPGSAAALLAGRLRVPGLLLFLGLGMLLGSDGLGWIDLSDYELARRIGIIALAAILFEGGLNAGFSEIRPVLRAGLSLALVGTLVTAAIIGAAGVWLFDLSTLEGLLLGAILSVTDGAAIFALLRGSTLRRRLARTLEAEAGFNDPVAILLVIGFIEWIQQPDYGVLDMVVLFVRQISIGLAVGLAVGFAAAWAFRRVNFATGGLYPVASMAAAALAFGAADSLHGSGFLAVYLAGLVLGSATIPARNTITVFHQGFAWVAQIGLFLTLGLLVFPSQLDDVWLEGTVLALVMMFIARPLATVAATIFEGFSAAERFALGVGRPARRRARGARHLRGDRGRAPQPRVLQHRLLRGGALDGAPGQHLRAARQGARTDHRRAGASEADSRHRHDPQAGRRGGGVPGGRLGRDSRALRARARACRATRC